MREHARAQHSTRVDTASPSACPANYPDPVPQPCPQHLPHPTRTLNNVLQQHARAQYSNCLPHYNRTQHARTKHSTRVDTASPSAYTFQLPRSTATTVSANFMLDHHPRTPSNFPDQLRQPCPQPRSHLPRTPNNVNTRVSNIQRALILGHTRPPTDILPQHARAQHTRRHRSYRSTKCHNRDRNPRPHPRTSFHSTRVPNTSVACERWEEQNVSSGDANVG